MKVMKIILMCNNNNIINVMWNIINNNINV